MKKQIDYLIKYVYPDWFGEEDMDHSVGFNNHYKNHQFSIGGKILIYVVEHQVIVGAYHIIDNFYLDKKRQHPIRLPIKKIYNILDNNGYGLDIKAIRKIVPQFYPNHLVSYFAITEEQYNALEKQLTNNI